MREQRNYNLTVGVRREEGKAHVLTGRAVAYNSPSVLLYGMFRERILPGAFDKCLARGDDIVADVNHDLNRLIGRTSAGTLTLTPGAEGIDVECIDPDTSDSRDLIKLIDLKVVRGMSFIFDVITDRWYKQDGEQMRDVIEADIYEVSWVNFPAYNATSAGVRGFGVVDDKEVIARVRESLALQSYARLDRELRQRQAEIF